MANYKMLHDYDGKVYDERTGETVLFVSSECDGSYFVTDGAGYSRLFVGFMPLLHFMEDNGLIIEWF